jgi:predicted site-specific integrase-resolvase
MFKPSRKAAKELGVHPNTLRKWADEGKIKYIRKRAGQRLYDVDSFIKGGIERQRICYCRVSSPKQKDDLGLEFMRQRYPNYIFIEDAGSGLNFKRKGLTTLLEQVCRGDVEEVVVAHRDRLARFGFDLIKWFVEHFGGKIVVLNHTAQSPEQELV